ncbi:MAG TPA: MBL fold metallo-hydrolase [Candidatus Polarisedimenticolia bacterium]|nr:MBL fold metallo-hydrolase [Candidatus Polarisedimenticolia bacterium]
MKLIQIEVGPMQNFNYLIGCPRTGLAAWVDPAWEAGRMLEAAAGAGLKVSRLLITHTHPDHIEALGEAAALTDAVTYVHEREVSAARGRLRRQDPVCGVRDNDTVQVGDLAVRALHTPGHTPGAVCWLVPGEGEAPAAVFTGDTLFIGRCGRTDFPGSDPDAMFDSLGRLASLGDETLVYPGHNYAELPVSTIGRERTDNVHMSAPGRREFLRRRMGEAWLARREGGTG